MDGDPLPTETAAPPTETAAPPTETAAPPTEPTRRRTATPLPTETVAPPTEGARRRHGGNGGNGGHSGHSGHGGHGGQYFRSRGSGDGSYTNVNFFPEYLTPPMLYWEEAPEESPALTPSPLTNSDKTIYPLILALGLVAMGSIIISR